MTSGILFTFLFISAELGKRYFVYKIEFNFGFIDNGYSKIAVTLYVSTSFMKLHLSISDATGKEMHVFLPL